MVVTDKPVIGPWQTEKIKDNIVNVQITNIIQLILKICLVFLCFLHSVFVILGTVGDTVTCPHGHYILSGGHKF